MYFGAGTLVCAS